MLLPRCTENAEVLQMSTTPLMSTTTTFDSSLSRLMSRGLEPLQARSPQLPYFHLNPINNFTLADGVQINEMDTALRMPPSSCGKHTRTERSCLVCHQRKIRCDKMLPCSNCERRHEPCRYPKEERGPRRPNKTNVSDVAHRLALLERAVELVSNGLSKTSPNSKVQGKFEALELFEATSSVQIIENQEGTKNHSLIQGGESNLYINEVQLSQILNEVMTNQSHTNHLNTNTKSF